MVTKSKSSNSDVSRAEERQTIERMTDEGFTPEEITDETGIPRIRIYNVRQAKSKREDRKAAGFNVTSFSPSPSPQFTENPDIRAARDKITLLKLQAEEAAAQGQLDFANQKNNLMLERMALENERMRRDMEPEQPELDFQEVKDNPDAMLMQLFQTVLSKPQIQQQKPLSWDEFASAAPAPVQQTQPTMTTKKIDVTKPLSEAEIDEQIAAVDNVALTFIRKMTPAAQTTELKKAFPGITPENIKRVIDRIRHYGK